MKQTRTVRIGNLKIGGGNPVAIQTMADVKTSKISDIMREIEEVYELGCDVFRVAVKDEDDARAIKEIKKNSPLPLVADVHFDYRLAIKAIDAGVDKIRINPGNVGGAENVRRVAEAIKAGGVAVRVGSNSGSVEKPYLEKYGRTPEALAESALGKVALLEKCGVENIVISLKASDVATTVAANRYVSARTDYPLHLGVTEAGTPSMGLIKSAVGIGSLLLDGIGDTIRVSLTAPIREEVIAAKRILRSVGLDKNFVEVVSCPTCGRTAYDCAGLAKTVEERTAKSKKRMKVAVMGCVVNGPGEAADCDLGIAGGDGKCVIFKKGKVLRTVPMENACEEFLREIDEFRLDD